ncbi:MAG: lamin tail domain-containing protein [Nitritalea sp.]
MRKRIIFLVGALGLLYFSLEAQQVQHFREPFQVQSHPEPFLEGWTANEIRERTRVFQAAEQGTAGAALAIQPIGTFDGEIWGHFQAPQSGKGTFVLIARSGRNGSGTRGVAVSVGVVGQAGEVPAEPLPLAAETAFPNADTPYTRYAFSFQWTAGQSLYFYLKAGQGAGSGTTARFYLDEVRLEEGLEADAPVLPQEPEAPEEPISEPGEPEQDPEVPVEPVEPEEPEEASPADPEEVPEEPEASEPEEDPGTLEPEDGSVPELPEVPDAIPLTLRALQVVGTETLLLQFSAALDPVFGLNSVQYAINGQEPTLATAFESYPDVVLLHFSRAQIDLWRVHGRVQVALAPLPLQDNRTGILPVQERLLEVPELGASAIRIQELMPNPREHHPLPVSEYVELYNTTPAWVYLEDIVLASSRRETSASGLLVAPESHFLLVPRARLADFEAFGPRLGLTNWPSFLVGGDAVRLYAEGVLLDELLYPGTIWRDADAVGSGRSIELVDLSYPCASFENIRLSEDARGGTPGEPNSVAELGAMAALPFQLEHWELIEGQEVLLRFNQWPDFSVGGPQLARNTESLAWERGEEPFTLRVLLPEPVVPGSPERLLLASLVSCSGTPLAESIHSLELILPEEITVGDILISELMFDPEGGCPPFIELKNVSKKFLDVAGLGLATASSTGDRGSVRLMSEQFFLLPPGELLVFTADAAALCACHAAAREEAIVEVSLPVFSRSEGRVYIVDAEGDDLESFAYSEAMHHPMLQFSRGVSLERTTFAAGAAKQGVWHSAASHVGYATPTLPNSAQLTEAAAAEGWIQVSPDLIAPDAPGVPTFFTIRYQTDAPGYTAEVRVRSVDGRVMETLCSGCLLGESGFWVWGGTHSEGKSIRAGYYILEAVFRHSSGKSLQVKKTLPVGRNL